MTATSPTARTGQVPSAQPSARPGKRGDRTGAASRAPWLLLAPFLALFILTFILPIFVAVGSSFTKVTRSGLFGEAGVTSEFAGFSNYAQALADGSFVASIGPRIWAAVPRSSSSSAEAAARSRPPSTGWAR